MAQSSQGEGAVPRAVAEHEASGRHVEVDGLRVFVREEGDGPPVLLLHGVPSSSFLYRKMLPELAARGVRAIAFDLPGVGLSDKPRDLAYDWHALAEWVGRVVEALHLRDVHLVVHDIAGPIGVEFAIAHPQRVRSLTIMNTLLDVAAFSPPFPMWLFRVPGLRHLVFATQHPAIFTPLFHRIGVRHPERIGYDDVAAYIHLLRRAGGHHSFLAIMDGFVLTPAHRDFLREGLLALDLPAQLLWGEAEIAIPRHQLEYIQQTFPLREQCFVDGRHFPQEDQPEACAEAIARFVRQVAAS